MLEDVATDARDKFNKYISASPDHRGNKYTIRMLARASELRELGQPLRESYKQAYREIYNQWVIEQYETPRTM